MYQYLRWAYTVESLYNGQVGAGDFVRYSEVSFIGRFHVNFTLKNCLIVSYELKMNCNSSRILQNHCMHGSLGCRSQTQPSRIDQ